MIRINLLPVRQVRKAVLGRQQFVIFVAILIIEIVAMFVLYQSKATELADKERELKDLQTESEQLKRDIRDFDQLTTERDRLLAETKIVEALERARTGPVSMLRELSDILSVGKGPTIDTEKAAVVRHRDPNAGYNPAWNPLRLWIEQMTEQSKRISLTGKAKDHDDVAELLKRLQLSRYFADVQLQRDDQMVDGKLGLKVIRFSLSFRMAE